MSRLAVLILGLAAAAHAASLRSGAREPGAGSGLDLEPVVQEAEGSAEAAAAEAQQALRDTASKQDEVRTAVEKLHEVVNADKQADANEHKLDAAMNEALKKGLGRSAAESRARQAVFDAQHRTYATVVNQLVRELDAVLDGHEDKADKIDAMRKQRKQESSERDRMLLSLQSECALRVQHVLNDLYEASNAVQYAGHMGRKSQHEQRLAFDKAIRAAKDSHTPKVGWDLTSQISKAVDAARETWIAAAGVHAFDQSLAPARARAEHLLSLATSQQRQCELINVGDVDDILAHKENVLNAMGAYDESAEDEAILEGGSDVGYDMHGATGMPMPEPVPTPGQESDPGLEQPTRGDVFSSTGKRHRLPKDTCVWSLSPHMSTPAIMHHLSSCRASRDRISHYHQGGYGGFPGAYGGYGDYSGYGSYGDFSGHGSFAGYGSGYGSFAGYGSGYGSYHVPHAHHRHQQYPQQYAAPYMGGFPSQQFGGNYGGYGGYGAAFPAFGAGLPQYSGANAFANAYAGMYGAMPPAMYGMNGQYFPYPPTPQQGPSGADAQAAAKGAQVPPEAAKGEEKKEE